MHLKCFCVRFLLPQASYYRRSWKPTALHSLSFYLLISFVSWLGFAVIRENIARCRAAGRGDDIFETRLESFESKLKQDLNHLNRLCMNQFFKKCLQFTESRFQAFKGFKLIQLYL